VRPFRRGDRDQPTRLVNAHAQAVVPGMSASVNTVLSSLERRTEIVYLAEIAGLPDPAGPPLPALAVRRSVGINGCRLSAVLGEDVLGQAAGWLRLAQVSLPGRRRPPRVEPYRAGLDPVLTAGGGGRREGAG
jgi:hypothetical protein